MAETYGKNIHIPQTTQDVFTNTYENSSVIIPKIDGLLDAIATYSPVLSVNSQTGNVLLSTSDIGEGTNLYYTDERAQNAVGGILSAEFTYDDVTPTISINSITYAKISGLGTVATQNANNINLSGGNIDGTTIGATTPAVGTFTEVILSQSVADTKYIDVSGSFTNSSGTVTGIIDLSPNVDLSVAASHQIYRLVPVLRPSIDQTTVTVLNNNVQLGSSSNNFSTLINNQSQLNLTASYSGTVTTYRGYSVANPSIAGGALTNWYGFYTVAQSAAANACGVAIGALSSATKNTYVLLGTNTIPTGNWGIYNSSTNANYFAGNVGIGTSTVSDPLTVSGNVSAGSFNSQLFSAGGQSLSLIAGASSSVAGARSTAIGNAANTTATTTDGTAVGYDASAGLYGTSLGRSAGAAGTGGVAVGYGANTSTGSYNVAIGYGSQSTGGGGLAFGGNANANAATTIGIAFGRNATLTANAQMVVGANNLGITDCYFGSGVTDPAPASTTINATGGSGTDIAGASITIAGGKPTGAGAGGDIIFKTAQAGTTGTTLRSLTERLRIASTGPATFTSSATATSFIPSGSTIPANGFYLPSANTPAISANSLDVMRFGVEASAVNYLLSTGRATGNGVSLVSQGSDTNINFVFGAKGSGAVRFATAATSGTAYTEQARVSHTASAVNYVNLTGAATGNGPVLSPAGSDTNISLNITPKGTGSVLINGPSTISGAATLSSTLGVTGAASFSSTGAFTGNLGVGGAASGTYNFNVSTASATQGYFGSTGANWCTVTIDATNTSQQSLVRFQEAATNKWLVGRSSTNTFIVYDSADAKYFITATTASKLELGANQYLTITNANNVVVGTAALATSATNGFLYIPTCAGAPSGTPTAFTGRVPLVYDSTNNKLYAYNSAWKSATFT